jgi:hypothetical protein
MPNATDVWAKTASRLKREVHGGPAAGAAAPGQEPAPPRLLDRVRQQVQAEVFNCMSSMRICRLAGALC